MEACVEKAEVIKVNLMNFMGYRNMVLEQKIKECLDAVRQGETEITIDRGDLTDDEVEYLQSEIERRIGNVL